MTLTTAHPETTTHPEAKITEVKFFGITSDAIEGSLQHVAVGYSRGNTVGVLFNRKSEFGQLFTDLFNAAPDNVLVADYIVGSPSNEHALAAKATGQSVTGLLYNVQQFSFAVSEDVVVRGSVRKGAVTSRAVEQVFKKVNQIFHCTSCRPGGLCDCNVDYHHLCSRSVTKQAMAMERYGDRAVTIAECPVCGNLMSRLGGIEKTVRISSGRAVYCDLPMPPKGRDTFCLPCGETVRMRDPKRVVNGRRVHFVGVCPNDSSHRVGTAPSHTRYVAVMPDMLERGRSRLRAAAQRRETREMGRNLEALKRSGKFSIGKLRQAA